MNKDNVSLWIRIETPVLLHRMFMLWYGCLGFTPAGEPQGAEIGRNKKKMDDLLLPAYQNTDFIEVYKTLRDKHLKNGDCSWLVEKRNEVTKEKPFRLEKSLILTLYLPNGAGVFPVETYTIEDEEDYSSLIV